MAQYPMERIYRSLTKSKLKILRVRRSSRRIFKKINKKGEGILETFQMVEGGFACE